MAISVPQFATPFRIENGVVAEVEQDTIVEVEQCVEAILRTIVGTRMDDPELGIPDESFVQQGPDLSIEAYLTAIEEAEPRARQLGTARLEELTTKVITITSQGVAGV